jgi:hypothetical protein
VKGTKKQGKKRRLKRVFLLKHAAQERKAAWHVLRSRLTPLFLRAMLIP